MTPSRTCAWGSKSWVRHAVAGGLIVGGTVAAALVGAKASGSGRWYRRLKKPRGTPPAKVFGPVWTFLYASMAYSAWRVFRAEDSRARQRALGFWTAQLALNAAWSPLFFGAHRLRAALAVSTALVPAIGAYAAEARKVDGLAAGLMLPYLGWSGYATYLNAGLVMKNR
ncbi:MAG: tryptophan-rich sensory protein [Myxococcales bacterium]|nr:tryptophan-rich sensory protein [Myxococcales bacterium]